MSRVVKVFDVFLSSPDDVTEERGVVRQAVDEINQANPDTHVEVIALETHGAPGAGTNAQEVVDHRLPETYDVYLCLMWTRFGTPTGSFGSGTEAEYASALKRRRATGRPEIMVYFKRGEVDPFSLDLGQLTHVREFQARVKQDGCLYWTFQDGEELAQLLRLHLPRVLQQLPAEPAETEVSASAGETAASDDLGFLELVEGSNDAFERGSQILVSIQEAMGELTAKVEGHTADIQAAATSQDTGLKRRMVDAVAVDIMAYAKVVEGHLPALREADTQGFEGMTRAALLYPDLDPAPATILTALRTLGELEATTASVETSIRSFQASFERIPRLTKLIILARRRASAATGEMVTEVSRVRRLCLEAAATLRHLLDDRREDLSTE